MSKGSRIHLMNESWVIELPRLSAREVATAMEVGSGFPIESVDLHGRVIFVNPRAIAYVVESEF